MLQPKKPLKQLIQNAFKKGTEKSEMKKKMPKLNAERERFEGKLDILNDKPKVKGTAAASSYQPSRPANDNAARYKATPATVSKPSASTPKGQDVPMGSGSKSKPSSESSSRYKSQK